MSPRPCDSGVENRVCFGSLCLYSLLSPTLGNGHRVGKELVQNQALGTGAWTSSKACLCNVRKLPLQRQITPRTLSWTSVWAEGKVRERERPCYLWRVGQGRPSFLGLLGYIREGPSPVGEQWEVQRQIAISLLGEPSPNSHLLLRMCFLARKKHTAQNPEPSLVLSPTP